VLTLKSHAGSLPPRLAINGRFLLQNVTGVQKVALEFVTTLDRLLASGEYPSLEVNLLAPARGDLVSVPELQAVRVQRIGRLTGHAWEQCELPRLVGDAPLLCLGNLAPLTRLASRRAPVHTMVHDLSYRYFPSAYSAAFRVAYNLIVPAVLARSAHVTTVSESERRAILTRYGRLIGPNRLTAVQNGGGEAAIHAEITEDAVGLDAGHPMVPARSLRTPAGLYVGSLSRRKNAQGIIDTAITLARERDFEFFLVGTTGASFKQTDIQTPSDVTPRIHFLGQINDPQQIEALYRRCKVFLFPSYYEASPLPPIEAMSYGCPVVAANIPSLRERCGDAAVYVEPNDRPALVTHVERILDDPATWEDLQGRGLAWAARFTWASQVRSILDKICSYWRAVDAIGS